MSPEIKEDSDCFLTVSFHILLIRLCQVNKGYGIRTLKKPAYLPLGSFFPFLHAQTNRSMATHTHLNTKSIRLRWCGAARLQGTAEIWLQPFFIIFFFFNFKILTLKSAALMHVTLVR